MGLQVDNLRRERSGRTVAYSQFLNDYKKDSLDIVYGFVEAREDMSLYSSCICNEIPKNCSIWLIPCNGKYNVRDTYNLIDWTTHSKQRICFFRDRDLSDYVEDDNDLGERDNCYFTDGYSIENSLITDTLFFRLLREVLGYQYDGYEKIRTIVDKFIIDKKHFEYNLKKIMAHIIFWKRKCIKSPLDTISIKDIVNIGKDQIVYKNDEYKISYIYSKTKVDVTLCNMAEIDKIELQISRNEEYRSIIRGHFLSEFFVLYCNAVKKCSQELSLKLDINNIIAPRCERIETLSEFVKNTYGQYFKQVGFM